MKSPLPRSLGVVIVWAVALTVALVGPEWSRPDDASDGRIRQTIRVALACYFLAEARLLIGGRDARFLWTLGWAAYLVHVALAFQFAFGWSHAAAVEQTRLRSGVGEGIYVSHLFTLLWTADVCWWWLRPHGHATRRRWVSWTLHGFMAFMVFNATVVYEPGAIRWAGAVGFVLLGALFARRMSSP
jgi:hypothetical protein